MDGFAKVPSCCVWGTRTRRETDEKVRRSQEKMRRGDDEEGGQATEAKGEAE